MDNNAMRPNNLLERESPKNSDGGANPNNFLSKSSNQEGPRDIETLQHSPHNTTHERTNTNSTQTSENKAGISISSSQDNNTNFIEKQSLVLEAYRSLSNLDIHKASNYLRNARLLDMNDSELQLLYTAVNRWIDNLKVINSISSPLEKGDKLFDLWYEFYNKTISLSKIQEDAKTLSQEHINRLKNMVISFAYTCYKNALNSQPSLKTEIDFKFKVYKCHKLLQNNQEALTIIQGICNKYEPSAMLYAELADCYYLNNNINNAKVIFREAFFINPNIIHLEYIETPFIKDIVKLLESEKRYSQQFINNWIPVYGYINNTFNIVRELKPIELHNIQNSISNMEAKLDDYKALGQDNPYKILPALLNRYFWLIEHYKKTQHTAHSNKSQITLLYSNIEKRDPHIAELLSV